ncbi:hypothetical protein Asulf_02215 [Archaeoglobus sulfaticallidus PM70-1]|uniref:Uncharacterized protein n=1 Tax=Archaeoglobus sulfaticallidus PM70-1 TaxID=387631 RepID=N0BGN4_9EURY|nr:DUF2250 domain-containing protein [Archaeoglobus sulfaticallidus]AGK62168.1 hypothetical protein Asulf_02215 [Archaeoglobus sulfaticallidus PM70-1]
MTVEEEIINLSELQKKVILHFLTFGPDTPKLMSRRLLGVKTHVDLQILEKDCLKLCEKGLIKKIAGKKVPKRVPTSSIKPHIKIRAKSKEIRRHGQYFELTHRGKQVGKIIKKEYSQ